jgi:hypothetical protein
VRNFKRRASGCCHFIPLICTTVPLNLGGNRTPFRKGPASWISGKLFLQGEYE